MKIFTVGSMPLEHWQGIENPLVLQWAIAFPSLEAAMAGAQKEIDEWAEMQEEVDNATPIIWNRSASGREVIGLHQDQEEMVVIVETELREAE